MSLADLEKLRMSKADQTLFLYDTSSFQEYAQAQSSGLDVTFPPRITWSDVLDCRIAPYTERSIDENCTFALGVHKAYILISAAQVEPSKA